MVRDNLILPEERWKSDSSYWANYKYNREDFKKKKKLEEELCSLSDQPQNAARTVTEKFDKSNVVKNEYKEVKELLNKGIHPVNIGKKSTFVSSTKVLIKKPEGRYLVNVSDTHAEVVGVSVRANKKCMSKFETLMNSIYNLDLKGY